MVTRSRIQTINTSDGMAAVKEEPSFDADPASKKSEEPDLFVQNEWLLRPPEGQSRPQAAKAIFDNILQGLNGPAQDRYLEAKLKTVIDLLQKEAPQRPGLLSRLGTAVLGQGDYGEMREAGEQALVKLGLKTKDGLDYDQLSLLSEWNLGAYYRRRLDGHSLNDRSVNTAALVINQRRNPIQSNLAVLGLDRSYHDMVGQIGWREEHGRYAAQLLAKSQELIGAVPDSRQYDLADEDPTHPFGNYAFGKLQGDRQTLVQDLLLLRKHAGFAADKIPNEIQRNIDEIDKVIAQNLVAKEPDGIAYDDVTPEKLALRAAWDENEAHMKNAIVRSDRDRVKEHMRAREELLKRGKGLGVDISKIPSK